MKEFGDFGRVANMRGEVLVIGGLALYHPFPRGAKKMKIAVL